MILDKIENIKRYSFLRKIESFDFNLYKKGKIEIDGKCFFGIGLEYQTKESKDCLWESHRKYLDVHVVLEGEELVQVSDIDTMETSKEYDEENDYSLYNGVYEQEIILSKGMFLVLYPNEVHKTAIALNSCNSELRKIVFKLVL